MQWLGDRRLEWSMVTIWSRRNMNELRFFQHVDAVPLASSYDASVPGTDIERMAGSVDSCDLAQGCFSPGRDIRTVA